MKRLSEKEIEERRKHIQDLEQRKENTNDLKRRIFLQATINILEKEINQGFTI